MKVVRTTCPYCAVQCNFDLHVEDGQVTKVAPTRECRVAGGTVCKKGLAAAHDLRHPDRLTTPLLRASGELRRATWDDARAYLREHLGPLVRHAPERIGVFGSGSLTNEKTYLLGKLARVGLRTPNIDYNGRYCMSSAATALNRTFGLDRGLGFPLADIANADLILLVGANVAETLPPLMQFLKGAKDRGALVFSVDPRRTVTANLAQHHLAVRPGTDHVLALALLNLLDEWGKVRPTAPSHGHAEVLAAARAVTPDVAATECGVDEEQILHLARAYAAATTPLVLTGRGAEQHEHGTETVHAWINLAFLAGHFGRHGGGYGTLTGQGNGQGGREHGQKADQLPGYRSLTNAAHRREMADFWGIPEADLPGPGPSAQELLMRCGTELDALLVIGANPAVSAAGAPEVIRRLRAMRHLIVIDFLPSETAMLADLVLPGSMWAEEEGTTTNLEGRVQRRRKAITAPGAAREDWRVLCDIAEAVGRGEWFQYDTFGDLQREFLDSTRGAIADYSGLSVERLDRSAPQWPVPHAEHPGTPHAYRPPYATPDGRARLHPVRMRSVPRGLVVTTGRHANQYQSGTQSRRNPALKASLEVQVHPRTAEAHGLRTGDPVLVRTPHGHAELPVSVTPKIRPDVVFVPFHWPDGANALTAPLALDPLSRMPAFKHASARLVPVARPVPTPAPPPTDQEAPA